MGLAVASWLNGDKEDSRYAVQRLIEEAPGFRLSEAHPLPYKEEIEWTRFSEALRLAGAPE